MPKNPLSNEKAYDLWSSFYDQYPNPTVAMDELFYFELWSHLSGQKILEVGCGTGRNTRKLALQRNQITALDLSPGMLEVAKAKPELKDVRFLQGNFLSMDLPESAFDVVLESLVLEHLEDSEAFFRKAASCLKSNGSLFLSEIHPVRAQAGTLAHFRVPDQEEEIHLVSFAHSEQNLRTAAKAAGFREIACRDLRGDERLAGLNPKWEKHRGQPMIQIWHFEKT